MQGGSEAEEIRFFRALINREVFFRRRTSALQRREAALSLIIPAVHPVFLLNKLLWRFSLWKSHIVFLLSLYPAEDLEGYERGKYLGKGLEVGTEGVGRDGRGMRVWAACALHTLVNVHIRLRALSRTSVRTYSGVCRASCAQTGGLVPRTAMHCSAQAWGWEWCNRQWAHTHKQTCTTHTNI